MFIEYVVDYVEDIRLSERRIRAIQNRAVRCAMDIILSIIEGLTLL